MLQWHACLISNFVLESSVAGNGEEEGAGERESERETEGYGEEQTKIDEEAT